MKAERPSNSLKDGGVYLSQNSTGRWYNLAEIGKRHGGSDPIELPHCCPCMMFPVKHVQKLQLYASMHRGENVGGRFVGWARDDCNKTYHSLWWRAGGAYLVTASVNIFEDTWFCALIMAFSNHWYLVTHTTLPLVKSSMECHQLAIS